MALPQSLSILAVLASAAAVHMSQKAVLLDTSLGAITFELYWDHAPKACENFYTLAQQGYYNGVLFHRIIKVCIYAMWAITT